MEGTAAESLQEEILLKKAEARVGSTLRGKWTLDALIGVGGMGAVYEATHRNGMRGAVKLLHPERSLDDNIKQRFMREGYIANKIDHVGAVRVLDDDDTDGTVFLVMELLEGTNIEMRTLRSEGLMKPDETMIAMDQALDTLAAAHEKGIIHRDLKPANIFLTKDGIVKILDYGIARLEEAKTGASATTEMGIGMGTPAFMAPEQARGRWDEVDARSDIWSLGATMFWMLTGTTVHEEGTGPEMLAATFLLQARSVRSVAPTVPRALAHVVDKALMLDKKDRWASAREMQSALREAYERIHGEPLPAPTRTQRLSVPRISAPSFGSLERTSEPRGGAALPSTDAAAAPKEALAAADARDAIAPAALPKTPKPATKADLVGLSGSSSSPRIAVMSGSRPKVDLPRERTPPPSLVPKPHPKFSTAFVAGIAGTVTLVAILAVVFSSNRTPPAEPKVAPATSLSMAPSAMPSATGIAHEIATSNVAIPIESPSVPPSQTKLPPPLGSTKKPKPGASASATATAAASAKPSTAPTQKPEPETIF